MATAYAYDPRLAPIVFCQPGDFQAVDAAIRALHDAGFSVGAMQDGSPRGVAWESEFIAKWRNLSKTDQLWMDGEMHGGRRGPVTIIINATAPDEALDAFARVRTAAADQDNLVPVERIGSGVLA